MPGGLAVRSCRRGYLSKAMALLVDAATTTVGEPVKAAWRPTAAPATDSHLQPPASFYAVPRCSTMTKVKGRADSEGRAGACCNSRHRQPLTWVRSSAPQGEPPTPPMVRLYLSGACGVVYRMRRARAVLPVAGWWQLRSSKGTARAGVQRKVCVDD